MEYSLLDQATFCGRENLLETYLGLAAAVPQSKISDRDDCVWVQGPADFSFCNFAAGFEISDEYEIERVIFEAKQQSGFWIFCIDGDRPSDLSARMEGAGFMLRQVLSQMVYEGKATAKSVITEEAILPKERLFACRFATKIFFSQSRAAAQEKSAQITANCRHRLFTLSENNQLIGSYMGTESHSALGLYNLCVIPNARNRGIGRMLVSDAVARAKCLEKRLVLQCDPALVEWYLSQGFRVFGRVRAYTFPN